MAVQAKAKKGGMSVDKAYLMITGTKMEKYLCPTEDPETKVMRNDMVTQHTSKVSIFGSREEREADFSQALFHHHFAFAHKSGADLVTEAYQHIKTKGVPGWELAELVDV